MENIDIAAYTPYNTFQLDNFFDGPLAMQSDPLQKDIRADDGKPAILVSCTFGGD